MKLNMFWATHAHRQEPKTAQAASGFACVGRYQVAYATWPSNNYTSDNLPRISGFAYVEGGRVVVGQYQVAYATWQRPTTTRPTIFHVCKTGGR